MITSCDHCEALRAAQAKTVGMGYPMYWPGDRDDPGPCPCECHMPWRIINKALLR